ncbi:MAG: NAD(P)/FAD-dependent oxidoreductase [Thermomicrobiales bacterium]
MTTYDLIIVGAGNLGLWTAHELARRGFGRIAVCERTWAGFGATTRSAGVVRQQGGSETAIKLGIWSRERYLRLGAELGLDSGFTETGYYVLAETEAEKAAFLDLVALRRACGMENEWVDAAEGRARFPGLDWENLLGATYTANDGYVHPPIVARNITFAAARHPMIDLFEQCTVEGIEQRGSRFIVRTTRGTFASDRVLDAGGPRGARKIGAMVGVEVPVAAARHFVVTYPNIPSFPMFFALAKGIYVRPEEQGALLGLSNPSEQADHSDRYQLDFDWDYFEYMRPAWESVFPALAGQRVSRSWAGSIDYTPDHLPIIDQPLEGFYVLAAGGHGMMWGPALGMKMAELIADGAVHDLPADEIQLGRFRAGYVHHDAIALPFPTT